jgi:putative transposase
MTKYRYVCIAVGSRFFTVNPVERKTNQLLAGKIDLLRGAFGYTKQRYPFPRIGGNHEGYGIGGLE